jgi:SpoIID/LytB domain protein
MSQWGMQGMANAGKTYEQILKHYYLGIALTQVGGA